MKKTVYTLLLLLSFSTLMASDALKYTIIQNPFRFTTYYEMIRKDSYEGRVVEDFFHARTTFDLYDSKGDYEAQGICRALSIGVIFPWAREIDIYDVNGKKIGLIDGKTFTTASAKFNFYDANDNLVCHAYYDYEGSGFTIVDPSKHERTLGYLKRDHTKKGVKDWDVVLYDCHSLDSRILKIFSAFVVKKQSSF